VLFMYLHIVFHLKTSEDLEIYEITDPSKEKLEEICDVRQPVIFSFECDKIMEGSNKSFISHNYPAFEVKIRNTEDCYNENHLYVPLPMHSAIKLFTDDASGTYLSENNGDFLEETGVIKNLKYNDEFLRPYMVSNCNYDILMASSNTYTPFRYEINYRNYFLVTEGTVRVKLTPPHFTKYLYPIYDYDNFEFRSPVNIWQPQLKYRADFDKIKFLEFTLNKGSILFIPAYWWYSFKFMSAETSISCFYYRTYMNNLAIVPYLVMYSLQMQNVKRNAVKKININELNYSNQPIPANDPSPSHKEDNNMTPDSTYIDDIQPIDAISSANHSVMGTFITDTTAANAM
jgi:hypothetical protein